MPHDIDSIAFRRPKTFSAGEQPIPIVAPDEFLNPYGARRLQSSQTNANTSSNRLADDMHATNGGRRRKERASNALEPSGSSTAITQLPDHQGEHSSRNAITPMMPTAGIIRRHGRVKLNLSLDDVVFIAGGHVSGRLKVRCKSRHNVRFGEIWVELQGHEQVMSRRASALQRIQDIVHLGNSSRVQYSLVNTRVFIQTAATRSARMPISAAVDPATGPDIQGCWQARQGTTTLSWRMPSPLDLPSIFESRIAKVKYCVIAGVDVLYKHRKLTVITSCNLPLYEVLNRQHQLLPLLLPIPYVQGNPSVIKRGLFARVFRKGPRTNQFSELVGMNQRRATARATQHQVKLRARINSSVWIAGTTGYIEVCLKTDVEKCVTAIKLVLQQKVETFSAGDVRKMKAVREQTKTISEALFRDKSILANLARVPNDDWQHATFKLNIPVSTTIIINDKSGSVTRAIGGYSKCSTCRAFQCKPYTMHHCNYITM
ncbi:hypothetical protein BDF22DRAFT_7531 [Syncephalis plumigaleata]|nr:hypothetical protein BDF22DRAFT_7531 [Syncephalis plumigaleata]